MTRIATVAAVLAILTMACGGSGSGGAGGKGGAGAVGGGGAGGGVGPAGLDRSKPITVVTETDKGSLCDWYAAMVGGYGTAPTCATYLLKAPPDKATCIADFPACTVTIGQFEDCVIAVVAAQALCTQTALTDAQTKPECIAVGLGNCFPN